MDIRTFYDEVTGTFSYLLADPQSGRAAVIDPVMDFDPVTGRASYASLELVLEMAEGCGWQIDWILETHAHADHLSGAGWVWERTGAPIAIGNGIRQVAEHFSRVYNLPDLDVTDYFDRLLEDGEHMAIGGLGLEVLHTPGHTCDSVTYRVEDVAFVGDTLFQPDFGTPRCDFPGGSADQLFDSIQRLYGLPPATRLMVGHDYPPKGREPHHETTVADSRAHNRHLRSDTSRGEFVALRQQRDAGLGLPRLLLPALQVNIRGGRLPEPDENGVSYLRIPVNLGSLDAPR